MDLSICIGGFLMGNGQEKYTHQMSVLGVGSREYSFGILIEPRNFLITVEHNGTARGETGTFHWKHV